MVLTPTRLRSATRALRTNYVSLKTYSVSPPEEKTLIRKLYALRLNWHVSVAPPVMLGPDSPRKGQTLA